MRMVRLDVGGTPSAASSCARRSAKRGVGRVAGAVEVDGDVSGDAARVEHDHPVGEHDRLVDVVGDQQDRRPVPGAQLAAAARASGSGSARRGRRTARRPAAAPARGPASGPAPPAAARRRTAGRPGALAAREPDLGQAARRPRPAAPRPAQAERHVVEHPLPGQQPGVLEHHRHLVGHRDRARCRRRRGRARRAPAAGCSCRSRCGRAARRTRPRRCRGRGRRAPAVVAAVARPSRTHDGPSISRDRRRTAWTGVGPSALDAVSPPVCVAMTAPSSARVGPRRRSSSPRMP